MVFLNVSIGRGTLKMELAHYGNYVFMTKDRPRVSSVEIETARIIV